MKKNLKLLITFGVIATLIVSTYVFNVAASGEDDPNGCAKVTQVA